MLRVLTIASVLTLSWTPCLVADVVETGCTRFVICSSQGGDNIDGPYQADGPATCDDFDGYVESFAWDDLGFHGGSSQSSQNSHIGHGEYSVDMWVRTDAGGGTMGTDYAIGYAETVFEVRFTLTEATDFNVSGSYNAFGFINGAISETEVRIDSLGGGTPSQVIAFTVDNCCPSVNATGVLQPGDYAFQSRTLVIVDHSFMMSYTDSNAANVVTMTLNVPPASPLGDMNCDGLVNTADVVPFIQALLDPDGYGAAFPDCDRNQADMNQDTLQNGADLNAFVSSILSA
ncbi:MAG: hypothetical protein KDA33_04920 [Phycisphaerales bacterium]|nr:hypothetical protein [Phycisphaerales bacterium]